ncbi:MAG: LuxR C-terminal-related transcriptional regulator [Chloroflexota bacterium]
MNQYFTSLTFDIQSHPPIYVNTTKKELTRREVEVLRLVGVGLSNQQVAVSLIVSINTVRAHMYTIFNKLDVRSRGAAVQRARERRLL